MSSTRFRKKPVVIEAVQWTGTNLLEVFSFLGLELPPEEVRHAVKNFTIPTLEGPLSASVGDWIIRGIKGEFYPCKPDIFQQTYDLADAPRESREHRELTLFPKWESSARTMAEWVFALYREDTSAIEAGKPEPIQLDFIPKPVVDASMWVLNKNEREPGPVSHAGEKCITFRGSIDDLITDLKAALSTSQLEVLHGLLGFALPLLPPKAKTPLEVAHERLQIGIRAILQLAQNSTDHAVKLRAAEQLIETYLPLVEAGQGAPDLTSAPPPAPKPELRERIMEAFRQRAPLGFDELIILAGDNAAIIAEVEKMAAEGVIEHAPGHAPGHFRPVYRQPAAYERPAPTAMPGPPEPRS